MVNEKDICFLAIIIRVFSKCFEIVLHKFIVNLH